jgi:hypothetical protein
VLRAFSLLFVALLVGCGSDGGENETSGPQPKPFSYPKDQELALNQLQLKASHNSYHIAGENPLSAIAYTHAPLRTQLDEQGVRGFELDTFFIEENDRFEVFHLFGLDEGTTCRLLSDCLKQLLAWSNSNPGHHPLLVQIEPKSPLTADPEALFQKLDAEILGVWPRDRVITPDDVQGAAPTLREAIVTNGWPKLGEVRGKILFFLDDGGAFREGYTHGGQDLAGRVLFANSQPGAAYEATYVLNDPVGDAGEIAAALADNFIVRTRCDSDNEEPLAGDTGKRDAALATGAQIVSTDYPAPVSGVDYVVEIPGGTPSRCNPVTAPATCTSTDIENPEFIQ